jgi:hypothetical protein
MGQQYTTTGFCCAVCGHSYRHKGMAERCIRTRFCRAYNMPAQSRRDVWRLVGGLGYVSAFCAFPICDTAPEGSQERLLAEATRTKADDIFSLLFRKHPMAEHVRRSIHDSIMQAVAHIWQPNTPVHICYLGEVLSVVAHEALAEAQKRGYASEETALMRETSLALDALYEFYEPDNTDLGLTDKVLTSIASLEKVILGFKPAKRVPSLYIVDDWQLVVAHGRGEVRRALASIGKVRPRSITGISAGEKFEDGRTAAEIIALARTTPCFIGEVEA